VVRELDQAIDKRLQTMAGSGANTGMIELSIYQRGKAVKIQPLEHVWNLFQTPCLLP